MTAAIYVGCAHLPTARTSPPPGSSPRPGGTLRLALSTSERVALAHHGLVGRGGAEAAFVREGVDRWRGLAPATLLDEIEFVSDRRIPRVELLLLGEVDLVPAYGREVARLREAAPQDVRLVRAAGWDRTYVLHCDTRASWTKDPNFRRWFAESVDRADLVTGLFDGFAAPAWSIRSPSAGPQWEQPMHHPFDPTSRPVLHLRFDPDDGPAAAIAARMKARFAAAGVELTLLTGTDGGERPALTLSGRQRSSANPVVDLEPMVTAVAVGGEDAQHYLELAKAESGGEREALLTLAEEALLADVLVVPLVRLEAWLAMSSRLRGVEPGLTGDLALEKAWWSP